MMCANPRTRAHLQETLMRKLLSHRSLTITVALFVVLLGASAFGAEAAVQRTTSTTGNRRVLGGSARARRGEQKKPAKRHPRRHKHRHHKPKHHHRRTKTHKQTKIHKGTAVVPAPGFVVAPLPPALGPALAVSPILQPVTSRPTPGKGSHTGEPESTPPPPPPTNTVLPLVSGSTTESQTLTTTNGTWSGSPTSYLYEWETCSSSGRECQTIAGAAAARYKLVAANVGHTIRVTVTATNPGGSTSATSAVSQKVKAAASPPPPAPTNTALPAISGTDTEGDTLKASTGSWSGSPTSYAYQWQDCNTSGASCTNLGGATGVSYTLGAGDVGHTIRVTVTAINAGGRTTSTSAASAAIAKAASPPPPAPTNTALPAIGGTDTEGDTLKASTGSWSGSPTSYAYQWQDCNTSGASCTNILGQTGATYTLGESDVGHTIRVTVTAVNSGGSTPATSGASATVAEVPPPPPPPAPADTALPAIGGTDTEGDTLKASTGSWSGSPTSYAYQWQDCNTSGTSCTNLGGATGVSYTLGAGDVGHTIRVTVTATNAGGSTPATSTNTAVVAAPTKQPPETPAKQPPASPACTQTVSSVSSAGSAASAASGEAAICLTAGSYGHLSLSGTHTGNVTVEPVRGSSVSLEGVSIAANSSGLTVHNFSIGGGVSLAAGDSHIAIDHNDINGQAPGGDGEGVETLSVNCSAPNAPSYSGCTTTTPDSYLTINGNEIHGYGEGNTEDAIHLNDWEHVTITANDIYDLEEHGNHTDAMQSVFGGHYMTFAYNYEHDNQAQGFFIKDGDVSEVTVNENLFLTNNNLGDDEYNVQVFDTTGFTMTNNTVWDGQADIIRAEGAAEALTANINHNVEQNFDVLDEGGPAYTLSENDDIFKEAPFTFTKGSQSKVEGSPDFANPASGDYELASNPDNIGVDWQPSEYVYGPTGR
jgi:hypothetical protein